MKCPNCGETSRIREKDKFCHKCGCNLKTGKIPARSIFDLEKLDATIESIEDRIIKNDYMLDSSAAVISALASLIQARALISKQEEE